MNDELVAGFTVGNLTFTSPEELIAYFMAQSREVQENGIWVVVTHPDAYSEEEKRSVETLKELSRKQKIPLFICRGSQLPNGWKRYDQ